LNKIAFLVKGKVVLKVSANVSSKLSVIGAVIIVFALVLYINLRTPFLADDYVFQVYKGKKIETFDEIYAYLHNFYLTWGGRLLPTGFSVVSSLFSKTVLSIINSIVFLILFLMVLLLAKTIVKTDTTNVGNSGDLKKDYKGPIKSWQVLLSFVFIAYFSPAFGQDVFWICGAYNYLWATTYLLILIYPLRLRTLQKESLKHSWWLCFLALPLYMIGGFFNEGCGATLVVSLVAICILLYKREKKVDAWIVLAFIGAVIGFLLLALAPGNFERMKFLNLPETSKFIQIPLMFFKILWSYFTPQYLLFPLLFVIFILCLNKECLKNSRRLYQDLLFWGFLVLVSTFCFVVSPSYDERVRFIGTVFACILVLSLVLNIQEYLIKKKFEILLNLAMFGFIYNFAVVCINETNLIYKSSLNITKSIDEQKQQAVIEVSGCDIYVPTSPFVSQYKLMDDTLENFTMWYQSYSVYKNVGTIKFVPCEK